MRIGKAKIPREGLHEAVNVPLPPDARVLSVSHEGVIPILYFAGDGEATEPRWFRICWTSNEVPFGGVFLGTIKIPTDEPPPAVWHLFELPLLRGKVAA